MSGSTNSKIKEQNKQVEKQYQYDQRFYEYEKLERQDAYDKAVFDQARDQDYLNQIRYQKNRTLYDERAFAAEERQQNFETAQEAFKIRSDTRDAEKGLNQSSYDLAIRDESRILEEGLLDVMFGRQDETLRFDKSLSATNFQGSEATRNLSAANRTYGTDSVANRNQLAQKIVDTDQRSRDLDRRANTVNREITNRKQSEILKGQQTAIGYEDTIARANNSNRQESLARQDAINEGASIVGSLTEDINKSGLRKDSLGIDIQQAGDNRDYQVGLAGNNISKLRNQKGIESINRVQFSQDARNTVANLSDDISRNINELYKEELTQGRASSDFEFAAGNAADNVIAAIENQKVRDAISRVEDSAVITDAELKKRGLNIQAYQLEKDKAYQNDSSALKNRANQLTYAQAQSKNLNDRLDQLVARNRALGQRRALGQEGKSAQRSNQSILAEYGRNQAQLVNNLVFAAESRDITTLEIQQTAANAIDKINASISQNKNEVDLLISNRDSALNKSILQRQANENAVLDVSRKSARSIRKSKADLGFNVESSMLNQKSLKTNIKTLKRNQGKALSDAENLIGQSNFKIASTDADISSQGLTKQKAIKDANNTIKKAQTSIKDADADIRKIQESIKRTNQQVTFKTQSSDLRVLANNISKNTAKNLLSNSAQQTINAITGLDIALADANTDIANKRIQVAAQVGLDQGVYSNSQLRNENTLLDASSKFVNDMTRINADSTFNEREGAIATRKFDASEESLRRENESRIERLGMDKTAADIASDSRVGVTPKAPVDLPPVRELPQQLLPIPRKPRNPPEPIKGAMGRTSAWNDVGDAINVGLTIASLF
tara:strand:- start:1557 stop:4082 length:2526 start_codon:yes stop_codon:yes gene_type:complete